MPQPTLTTTIPPLLEQPAGDFRASDEQLKKLIRKRAQLRCEALRLYEPMLAQQDFHSCVAREVLVLGSNRAGKTLCVMAETARAATGQDPFRKYPETDGRIVVVGKDLNHIGQVIYRKLFRSGAFRMIRDLETREWRAYRPWIAEDEARKAETKPAPPLIPKRYFAGEPAWKNKKANVPQLIKFRNGWEMSFFSSEGKPPQGIDVDVVIFDEELIDPDWYVEMAARLLDRGGRFIWGATPQNSTPDFFDLHTEAKKVASEPNPRIVEFKLTLDGNQHMAKSEKELLIAKYANRPHDYQVRILGNFDIAGWQVYPNFSPGLHGRHAWDSELNDEENLSRRPVRIDLNWNYYMVVDPGRSVCAVTFWAVPYPEHPCSGQVFLFDELYMRNCNTTIFADRVMQKIGGRFCVDFIIDPSSTKQDIIGGGAGASVYAQYSEALKERGISCHQSGSQFTFGNNDKKAGLLKFESWLYVGDKDRPKFQYIIGAVPNFLHEIEHYRRKKIGGQFTDDAVDKDDHIMDTCRYMAMRDSKYITPPKRQIKSRAVLAYESICKMGEIGNQGQDNSIYLG